MDKVLTAVCRECCNYFAKSAQKGTFAIEDTVIEGLSPEPKENQYIRIKGSVFNDGVWKYPISGGVDEVFDGEIWLLAIPADFIELANDIRQFQESDSSANSSVVSENYHGVFSYTKATSKNGVAVSWREVFASRLHSYHRTLPENILGGLYEPFKTR